MGYKIIKYAVNLHLEFILILLDLLPGELCELRVDRGLPVPRLHGRPSVYCVVNLISPVEDG